MKFFRFLKNLKVRISEEKRELEKKVRIFTAYFDYLENGKYKFDSTCTKFYNVARRKQVKRSGIFLFSMMNARKNHNIDFSTCLARKIISRRFVLTVKTDSKKFCGSVLIMSSNSRIAKIFDFQNNILVSLSSDVLYMKGVLARRENFAKYFKTPQILSVDIQGGVFQLVEEFRNRKSISIESLFCKIMKAVFECQKKNECVKTQLTYSEDDVIRLKKEIKKFATNDGDAVEGFIRNGYYKKCICHGDLFRFNVIYDCDCVWFIDFEVAGERIFFHDIFSFVFSEMFYFNNDSLFQKYLEGKFDYWFEKLFDVNGLRFEPLNRRLYFFIALVEKYGGVIPDNVVSFINSRLEIAAN